MFVHVRCGFATTLTMFLGQLSLSTRLRRIFYCLAVTLLSTRAVHGQTPVAIPGSAPSAVSTNARPVLSPEQITAKLAELRSKAEKGDPVSQNILGDLYNQGRVVKEDLAEAAKWYRKSAEQGFPPGQFNLGLVYENGEGIPKDPKTAIKWYRKAAKKGFVPAEYNLGLMLLKGIGEKKDLSQGAQWIKKAAEGNDTLAQIALAGLYLNGEGFPVDKIEALAWLNLAAQNPKYNSDSVQITYQDIQKSLSPNQISDARDRSKVLSEEMGKRLQVQEKWSPAVSPSK